MTKFSLLILKVLNDNHVVSPSGALSVSQILELMGEAQRKSYSTTYRHLSNMQRQGYLYYYSVCNPDVLFALNYLGQGYYIKPTKDPIDKSKNISVSFYDYDTYKRFIRDTQDGNTTYKQFLGEYFGTRIKNTSNNGKYAVTVRQIWYKLREIAPLIESKRTYSDFTQNIITEWIDANPEFEDKVNFSDRGNFYVDGSQIGLGTANVRGFINTLGKASNTFDCYGGISSIMHIEDNFNLEYKYDKVLYIEKTGFDAIFRAEKVGEKYNMIIVSGQGFSTRAAKTLLHELYKRGLRLYCLHDLDISGVFIFNSSMNVNMKFKYEIPIEDLGVTFEDVERYGIEPELVSIKKEDSEKLQSLSHRHRKFFDAGNMYRRVELNAFTTEQMLEILDSKLSDINNLPTINLEDSLNIDHNAIKQTAFMRVMADRYKDQLNILVR